MKDREMQRLPLYYILRKLLQASEGTRAIKIGDLDKNI